MAQVRKPGQVPALTQAAIAAGHEPRVERHGGRFLLACSCGFKTRTQMNRKTAFQAIADHIATVGMIEKQKIDTPNVPESLNSVSGRS